MRTLPFARAMLAASFASPLLEKLQHRVIYFHIWYSSKSGKTAALKFAMSVWGDPQVLVSKYFSTIVGMERWAGTLKHLSYAMDELQTLNQKRLSVNDIVYTLGNGSGKTRGHIGSGLQKVETWRNCILSTGEQPMTTDSSMDGVNTRLMEIYAAPLNPAPSSTPSVSGISSFSDTANADITADAIVTACEDNTADAIVTACEDENGDVVNSITPEFVPIPDEQCGEENSGDSEIDTDLLAQRLHQISEENYGFAGEKFIHFVADKLVNDTNDAHDAHAENSNAIKADYRRIESFPDAAGIKRSQIGKRIQGILTRVYALNLKIEEKKDTSAALSDEE